MKSIEGKTVRHAPAIHPWYSSHTLSTPHPSRTHVKAPQTDLHGKPDNSSGPTHDSPSERLLRTKATFHPKQAPKKHREHQSARGPPKPSTDQLFPMPLQVEDRSQGPKGSIETQTASTSMLRAMEEASKHQVRLHGSMPRSPKPSRLDSETGFGFSLFGKKDKSFFLSL